MVIKAIYNTANKFFLALCATLIQEVAKHACLLCSWHVFKYINVLKNRTYFYLHIDFILVFNVISQSKAQIL